MGDPLNEKLLKVEISGKENASQALLAASFVLGYILRKIARARRKNDR
jgi:hypothetical protein